MKPNNFTNYPWNSILQNFASEKVAQNIMKILKRTGNEFRKLSFEEYKAERLKDGNYTDNEEYHFYEVIMWCANEQTASLFCKKWAKEEEEQLYYVRTEGYVGNALLWWGPNHSGYISDIKKAGKYTMEEAMKICRGRSTEKAYLCSTIDKKVEAHKLIIDAQYIDKNDMAFNLESLDKKA